MSLKRKSQVKKIIVALSLVVICGTLGFLKWESLRSYRQELFVEAAFRGNTKTMKLLLLIGANVDAPACQTRLCPPPIVASAFNEDNNATRLLLDRGANINGKMNRGDTALMIAAHQGHVNIVRLL